jgi:hypothetical protein
MFPRWGITSPAIQDGVRPVRSTIRFLGLFALTIGAFAFQETTGKSPLANAIQTLNSSPWARQETFTRVVSGYGSGESGEKEIFNTFYVRFFSAPPIRQALLRIQQIQYGYDGWAAEEKRRFDESVAADLLSGFGDWIVVTVGFRSNDPNEESNVRRFFERQNTETLNNKAFLSTEQFSQVRIHTYFAPRDEGIGAKFVFPRQYQGTPLVSKTSKTVSFELLDVPTASPRLRARFAVKDMTINGQVVF